MASQSFFFARDFDAEIEAERHIPAGPSELISLTPLELETLLANARAEGHAEGITQGRAEALAEAEAAQLAQQITLLERLMPEITELSQTAAQHRRMRESDLARLVLTMAEKIAPEVISAFGPRRVAAFARHAARIAEGQGGLRVEVAPDQCDTLAQTLAQLTTSSGAPLELVPNPQLAPLEARAFWQGGQAEFAADRLLTPLLQSLRALVQAPSAAEQGT